jgi:phage terminase large subunit GpA-like protein
MTTDPERERLLAAWWDAQDHANHAHFPQWASRELADHATAEAFDAYYNHLKSPKPSTDGEGA